jgi:hypothetical protein
VTTLARNKNNSINYQLKNNSTLSRNGGVLIAVKDWIAKATPVASTSTTENNCTSICGGQKIKMPNNHYENCTINNTNDNIINNNNNPPYENQSIILQQQKLVKDEQGNPTVNGVPLYAVVNKQNKLKNKLNETKYSYIGIADPTDRNFNRKDQATNIDSKATTVECADLYETIKISSYNNISTSNNNNNNNPTAVKLTNFGQQNSNIKTSHITTTTCINSNDMSQPLPTSSSLTELSTALSATTMAVSDYSKVWKGAKKSSNNNNVDNKKTSSNIPRMWTCCKCSYAYNALWAEKCDICECLRGPASLNQPSLTTVTKDGLIVAAGVKEGGNNKTMTSSKSLSYGFDEMIAAGVRVPMATFEQDLEDDFQFLPGE